MADSIMDGVRLLLITAGVAFFIIGSIGLIRFPDVYTRIHALTKADNLGLGLIVIGLLLGAGSLATSAKLVLIWLLTLVASASAGYLVARAARRRGVKPWQAKDTPPAKGDDTPPPQSGGH